jgi:hypothetical protein
MPDQLGGLKGMAERSAVETLAQLLQSSTAKPVINAHRFAPSAVYDLQYRMFIIGAAFEMHAKPFAIDRRRISTSRLKFLQFVAMRPWLVPIMREWSDTQGYAQQSLLSPHQFRRGFLGDTTYDETVDFLVARGVFDRQKAHLADGSNIAFLNRLYTAGLERELFGVALQTLKELSDIKITNPMLEGW